jgi:hypothetical protein
MISGSPGFDNRLWLRAVAIFQRLPELLKRVNRLETKVEERLAAHAATSTATEPANGDEP